jgi:acyl-coenzyme A synthetase/AMP-(fatty) acid ligase
VPREVIVAEALPRNALGKVVKPELVEALRAGQLR